MPGLLNKYGILSRPGASSVYDNIYQELVQLFATNATTDEILILDPFIELDTLNVLYGATGSFEELIWVRLIQEFSAQLRNGKICIISEAEGIQEWYDNHWEYEHQPGQLFPWLSCSAFPALSSSNVEIAIFSWDDLDSIPSTLPRILHDRCIIVGNRGWQIGNSLNSGQLKKRDLLVTEMDAATLTETRDRLRTMLSACGA